MKDTDAGKVINIASIFNELTKAQKPLFDSYFRARRYESSHYNFTNFYMWRRGFQLRWAEADGVLYIIGEWQGKALAIQPITEPDKWAQAVANIIESYKASDQNFYFSGVEQDFADFLTSYKADGVSFILSEERDAEDYVYLADKLITLSGRKLHSKKNHLNAFRKAHPEAEYLPITPELVPACLAELESWYEHRAPEEQDDPYFTFEHDATVEILSDFPFFGLKGGAIKLGDRVIAFTFGEALNDDTVVVHVEKADPDVREAFPAINQGFIEHAWSDMTYVNREEDLGLEGLRKAKESYKPVTMIKKYNAVLA